jgi:hypothetical protein
MQFKRLKLMIPRGTRARPILEISLNDGVLVYLNNINSPERSLISASMLCRAVLWYLNRFFKTLVGVKSILEVSLLSFGAATMRN